MSIKDQYLEKMYDHFGFFAAWFPNQKLELGMVGVLERGAFTPKTTLRELGIEMTSSQSAKGNLEHQYGTTISFGLGAGGEVQEPGGSIGASASILCNKHKGFVFRAADCTEHVIKKLDDVEEDVKALHRDGKWKDDWVYIHRLYRAASTTVILTDGKNSSLTIEATGAAETGAFNLADAGIGLKVGASSGQVTTFLTEARVTPMYQASFVHSKFWKDLVVETKTFGGGVYPVPLEALLEPGS